MGGGKKSGKEKVVRRRSALKGADAASADSGRLRLTPSNAAMVSSAIGTVAQSPPGFCSLLLVAGRLYDGPKLERVNWSGTMTDDKERKI